MIITDSIRIVPEQEARHGCFRGDKRAGEARAFHAAKEAVIRWVGLQNGRRTPIHGPARRDRLVVRERLEVGKEQDEDGRDADFKQRRDPVPLLDDAVFPHQRRNVVHHRARLARHLASGRLFA